VIKADLLIMADTTSIKIAFITTVPVSLGFYTSQAQYLKSHGFAVYGVSSPGKLLEASSVWEQIPIYAVDMPRRIAPCVMSLPS
jgi:hypothetical protein